MRTRAPHSVFLDILCGIMDIALDLLERKIPLIRRHAERYKASAVARSPGNDTAPACANRTTQTQRGNARSGAAYLTIT
jgi:hypothetical protein